MRHVHLLGINHLGGWQAEFRAELVEIKRSASHLTDLEQQNCPKQFYVVRRIGGQLLGAAPSELVHLEDRPFFEQRVTLGFFHEPHIMISRRIRRQSPVPTHLVLYYR